jgi:glyoxylase-like metal-dependent hydrolase (beta-lactamase superfamily II)
MRHRPLWLAAAFACASSLLAAQQQPQPANAVSVLPVQGSVSLITAGTANVTVQIGKNGPVLVDTPPANLAPPVLDEIRKLSPRPIRHIIQTSMSTDRIGGTAALLGPAGGRGLPLGAGLFGFGARNAARPNVAAQDNVLNRLSAATPAVEPGMLPTMTYFMPYMDLYANDEAIVLYHVPAAHTDGDSIVFFRRSDVISTGDVYTPGRYPVIDVERGGTVKGLVLALGKVLELAVPEAFEEGGTKIIPGVGRVGEETDVAEFRDMVAIIRDRVQDGINRKQTLEQVKAARPSRDYDAEYGATQADADRFVESVYRTLTAPPAAPRPATRTAGGKS